MWHALQRLSVPKFFYPFAKRLSPWVASIFFILVTIGSIDGLFFAPADYRQGDGYRIIYVHVPAAILSLLVYTCMTVAALIGFIWQLKLADVFVKASAKLGAWFTFLALVSGSIWGKPMWGTWWVWDARLTSELILLFLYLGILAFQAALPKTQVGAKAVRVLVCIGFINIPIIHYSVNWWHTLHQGATLSFFGPSSIAPSMLYPLLMMIMAFCFFYAWIVLLQMRSDVLWMERKARWVKETVL